MQGMGDAILDRVLGSRQGLPEHLTAKNLRAADIATGAAEDVVLNPLQPE